LSTVDFFVGTGDINSSFLPKLKPDLPDLPSVVPPEKGIEHVQSETSLETNTDLDEITQRQEKQALDVAKQLEERPLAKAQETVLGEGQQQPPTEKKEDAIADGNMQERPNLDELDKRIRKAVLNDDDRELDRVEAILVDAHRRFYEMHDARLKSRSNPIPDISVSSTKKIAHYLLEIASVLFLLEEPRLSKECIWSSQEFFHFKVAQSSQCSLINQTLSVLRWWIVQMYGGRQ